MGLPIRLLPPGALVVASKPRRWLPIALVFVLALGVAIALAVVQFSRSGPVERTTTLYYGDRQALFLVPITERVSLPGSIEDRAGAIVERLRKTPSPDLLALMPPGVTLQHATYQAPSW